MKNQWLAATCFAALLFPQLCFSGQPGKEKRYLDLWKPRDGWEIEVQRGGSKDGWRGNSNARLRRPGNCVPEPGKNLPQNGRYVESAAPS